EGPGLWPRPGDGVRDREPGGWPHSDLLGGGRGHERERRVPRHGCDPGRRGSSGHRRAHREGETVLIVEDEDAMREVTRRILARNVYEVLVASGGPAALEIVRDHPGPLDL